MSHPGLMLIPIAPYFALGVIAWRTKAVKIARVALVLLLVFGAFFGFRLVYPWLRPFEDEWLLLSLILIGLWEVFIAAFVMIIAHALERRRAERGPDR